MHSFFVAPSEFDVIVVSGPDTIRFLQGQLTCDVESVAEAGFCFGAACNNKGRVFAAFTLIRWRDSCYLCMAAGLGAVFLSALKKYLPFYKCSMQMSGQTLYALAGEGVQKALSMTDVAAEASASTQVLGTADGWLCLLDAAGPRALLLTTRSLQEVQALLHPVGQGSVAEWEAVSMLAGHYPFRATDAEQFTPQELSYDRNGYVSFSKGCYTGQEIVARMHYRGKLKKQLYLITVDSRRDSFPDDVPVTFCSSDGAEIARSLTSRHLGDKTLALALLPVELADNTVNLCTSEGQTVHYSAFSRVANDPMVT